MHEDESGIGTRLQQCVQAHASVTDAAITRLKGLLEGAAQERLLTQGELSARASQLMADMMKPVPPKAEGRNAN